MTASPMRVAPTIARFKCEHPHTNDKEKNRKMVGPEDSNLQPDRYERGYLIGSIDDI